MNSKHNSSFQVITTLLIALCTLAVLGFFLLVFYRIPKEVLSPSQGLEHKEQKESKVMGRLEMSLADPNQAPLNIRDAVMLGYRIMLNTAEYVPQYAGDQLSCTNCHFAGGDTKGGKDGGISLAGSASQYPKYSQRTKQVQDLAGRINECFEYSMNGKALPLDSKEMIALVTYLQWISKGSSIYEAVPWLGLPSLKSKHQSNAEKGKEVYALKCASCNGLEGQGERGNRIPPVWGPHSYNDAAGMHRESTLASFIFFNMPYNEPRMSMEDAIDVAAYIAQQPRPRK